MKNTTETKLISFEDKKIAKRCGSVAENDKKQTEKEIGRSAISKQIF